MPSILWGVYPIAETMPKVGPTFCQCRYDPVRWRICSNDMIDGGASCAEQCRSTHKFFYGRRTFLFINGDVAWHKKIVDQYPTARVVIVHGSPVKLMGALQKMVWVDYGKKLQKYFNIKKLPAYVVLEGRQYCVSEGLCWGAS